MIKNFIMTNNSFFIRELRKSIKSIEIEEVLDLVFHRPLGLIFTWFAIKFRLTPLHVSLLSLLAGVVSGVFFFWQENILSICVGSILLTVSAIFDSSDGQLARLTGTSSEAGMIIDGIIDNAVFVSVYFFGCTHFYPEYGFWIIILGVVSGFANSIHSLAYDFYKHEVSFLASGVDSMRNPTLDEVKEKLKTEKGFSRRIRNILHLDYVRKQYWFTIRKGEVKQKFETFRNDLKTKDEFKAKYKEKYSIIMRFWALCGGTNMHRTLMMVFSFFAAFDYYLYFNLIVLTIPVIVLILIQNRMDNEFLKSFEE